MLWEVDGAVWKVRCFLSVVKKTRAPPPKSTHKQNGVTADRSVVPVPAFRSRLSASTTHDAVFFYTPNRTTARGRCRGAPGESYAKCAIEPNLVVVNKLLQKQRHTNRQVHSHYVGSLRQIKPLTPVLHPERCRFCSTSGSRVSKVLL